VFIISRNEVYITYHVLRPPGISEANFMFNHKKRCVDILISFLQMSDSKYKQITVAEVFLCHSVGDAEFMKITAPGAGVPIM
jgi:hypothetical protein